jgi:hypothetical protein
VPGFWVADSCAAEPAIAADVEFVTEHVPPLFVPMPRLSGLVVAGVTAVNVTLTVPAVVTVYVNVSELPCDSEPLNVSVVGPVVVEGEDELSNGLHAGMLITETMVSPI